MAEGVRESDAFWNCSYGYKAYRFKLVTRRKGVKRGRKAWVKDHWQKARDE